MNRSVHFLTLLFPLLLLGCGVEAPRPALGTLPPTPRPPLSTVSVMLRIPEEEIAAYLNARTQEQIADLKDQEIKCPFGRCRLDLTAFRTGPATVSAGNGQLGITLPFRLKAALASSGFMSLGKAQGDAQGMAIAGTPLSLGEDWKLHSKLNGRIQLSNAHLRLGPLVTNVSSLWDEGGQNLSTPIWHMLDGEIARIALKPDVETLWSRAFEPFMVGKTPAAWLVLRPQSLAVMQPRISNGALTLSLMLIARGEVIVQDQIPSNPPAPLPKPIALAEPSNLFSVAMPFVLPYAQAEQLALASLTRHPPRVRGMTLSFSSLHILPSDRDMVVETRFCARPDWDFTGWFASCAHLYLRGQPSFDPATETIRVANLRYDVASANAMLKILNLFASSEFTKAVGQTLVFDISRQVGREENTLRGELAQPRGKTLSISARVQSFGAPSFSWTKDGFLALVTATGSVEAAFKL